MINPYDVLGISQSTNYESIRKKYIQLAKKYHPDNFASSGKVSEEKMKKINNVFNQIKESLHHEIIYFYNKGKFTQDEINEAILRFNKGQSLNKMAREMSRSRQTIRNHLIKLGYITKPAKQETVLIKTKWHNVVISSSHTILFIFMTISMILSFPYMGLMSLAFIILISD